MSENENDYGLDGSAKDFSTYIDGDQLDPQSALLLERELQNDEQNLPARLKLLFYYSQKHVDNVEAWVSIVLWMVKNRPKDWLSGNLQWPPGLSEAQFLQIKEQWFSVIDSNLKDADIIGRAGQFISGRDTSAAEILFKTAQTLDKENICWSRMLTYNYMRQAEVGTLDQKAMYTELTFESADATLSAEQHDGEKNGLLTELCEFSLIKRDTKRAHYYAESLKKHVDKYGVKHQLFQAYCFLGRAALLNDDIETANNCLIQASKCGYFPALKLANDLLQRGERKTVLFFLQMCLASACEDRAIVSDWVRQIENNQTPTLAI